MSYEQGLIFFICSKKIFICSKKNAFFEDFGEKSTFYKKFTFNRNKKFRKHSFSRLCPLTGG